MARRSSGGDDSVSLFPFLSILVCVIGILTLMIVASSLGDAGKPPDPVLVERTKRFQELKASVAANEKKLEGLSDNEADTTLAQARIQSVQKELDKLNELKKAQDAALQAEKRTAELAQVRDSLKARLQQLAEEQKKREELAAELEKEIEEKGRPAEAPLKIRPTGSNLDVLPSFVECSDSGIALHEGENPTRIRLADVTVAPEYLSLLNQTKENARGVVVFLLRDNGLATYDVAKSVADQQGVRSAKLPLIGQGYVDLSAMERFRKRARGKD